MNFYIAIMKAANHLERRPRAFDFTNGAHPGDIDGATCPLAWIGFFAGIPDLTEGRGFVDRYAGDVGVLLSVGDGESSFRHMVDCGVSDAASAPNGLRAYAEKYFGHQKLQSQTKDAAAFDRFVETALSEPKVTAAERSGAHE